MDSISHSPSVHGFYFCGNTGCFVVEPLSKLSSNAIFWNSAVHKKVLIKFSIPCKCWRTRNKKKLLFVIRTCFYIQQMTEANLSVNFRSFLIVFPSKDFAKNIYFALNKFLNQYTQSAFTWSKLTIETLEQGVKYVQS